MSTKKIDIANDILDYLLDEGYIILDSNYNNYEKDKAEAAQVIVKRLQDYVIVQGVEVE